MSEIQVQVDCPHMIQTFNKLFWRVPQLIQVHHLAPKAAPKSQILQHKLYTQYKIVKANDVQMAKDIIVYVDALP